MPLGVEIIFTGFPKGDSSSYGEMSAKPTKGTGDRWETPHEVGRCHEVTEGTASLRKFDGIRKDVEQCTEKIKF